MAKSFKDFIAAHGQRHHIEKALEKTDKPEDLYNLQQGAVLRKNRKPNNELKKKIATKMHAAVEPIVKGARSIEKLKAAYQYASPEQRVTLEKKLKVGQQIPIPLADLKHAYQHNLKTPSSSEEQNDYSFLQHNMNKTSRFYRGFGHKIKWQKAYHITNVHLDRDSYYVDRDHHAHGTDQYGNEWHQAGHKLEWKTIEGETIIQAGVNTYMNGHRTPNSYSDKAHMLFLNKWNKGGSQHEIETIPTVPYVKPTKAEKWSGPIDKHMHRISPVTQENLHKVRENLHQAGHKLEWKTIEGETIIQDPSYQFRGAPAKLAVKFRAEGKDQHGNSFMYHKYEGPTAGAGYSKLTINKHTNPAIHGTTVSWANDATTAQLQRWVKKNSK